MQNGVLKRKWVLQQPQNRCAEDDDDDDDDTDDTELIALIKGQRRRHCMQFSG